MFLKVLVCRVTMYESLQKIFHHRETEVKKCTSQFNDDGVIVTSLG